MKKKERLHDITGEFLLKYQEAAFKNATDLLQDATILFNNERYARAYFLAIASIEETGKAWLAFGARGRNLTDQGLKNRLKQLFEDHSHKTVSAFSCWMLASEAMAKEGVKIMMSLTRGRELSMYVDASATAEISEPDVIVGSTAAASSIRIASECFRHTYEYVSGKEPPSHSSFDDKFLCFKPDMLSKMTNSEDFVAYLLDTVTKQGAAYKVSEAFVTYHDVYFSRGRKFSDAAAS